MVLKVVMTNSPGFPGNPNPYLRAFKQACIVTVVIWGLGAVLAGLNIFADSASRVAEITGSLSVGLFVLVFLASAAWQFDSKGIGVGLATVAGVLTILIFILWILSATNHSEQPSQLSEAEKELSSSGLRLCNQQLGFSTAALPADFKPAPEIQRQINDSLSQIKAHTWVFENNDGSERVLLQVVKNVGRKEATFRGFTNGLSRVAAGRSQLPPNQGQLSWSNSRGEYQLTLKTSDEVTVSYRCLASALSAQVPPVIVCVNTMSFEAGAWEAYRNSLALNGC